VPQISRRTTQRSAGAIRMKYIDVAQAAGRWLVSVENEVPQSFSTRGQAVVAAHAVAKRIHHEERRPAAVRALLANGEWRLLSRFETPA
jgi:hypothetical protein